MGFDSDFRRVFDDQHGSLFRYMERLIGDRAAAADLSQEAFVRLYERGSMPNDTRAWLVSVAHNLMRDAHRTRSRRARLLDEKAEDLRPTAPPSPDSALVSREQQARVRSALETLPERDRRALLLRHEGYSYGEIARALDYAPSGIGKLLVRAHQAFRRAFEEVGENAPQ
jgi:RNA polymerase sigma factor (sigma-70 family)